MSKAETRDPKSIMRSVLKKQMTALAGYLWSQNIPLLSLLHTIFTASHKYRYVYFTNNMKIHESHSQFIVTYLNWTIISKI